jgi:hypothetical protein
MTTVHVKLTPPQILTIYSYIFTAKSPNIGMDRDFNTILDRFGILGVAPSDDGTKIMATGLLKDVELDFSKREVAAMKYVILLHLTPDPKNDFQVPLGIARSIVWPLCRALGIEQDVKKSMPPEGPDKPDVILDSEYEAAAHPVA